MSRKQIILRGTFILTIAGILSRIMGFFYRIFLSRTFGEESVGLYQLIFPIFTLCYSITTAGIETAISRTVARKTSLNKEKESINILFSGLLCSLLLSLLCCIIIHKNAYFIAANLLGDLRCEPLLKILVYTIPFSAIHSCITGFYYGQKQSKIPAQCQLIEQVMRITSVFLLYYILTKNNHTVSISLAVIGLVIGELSSAVHSLHNFHCFTRKTNIHFKKFFSFGSVREILSLSLPLTANRILVNLLQSIEAVSIPAQLQKFGLGSAEALSIYGVLNGMALPCILFPSAITSSVSAMLMPTVAEIQAAGNKRDLLSIIKRVCGICFLLGLVCCAGFLISGSWIGSRLFGSETAGNFIITLAWICPFLYTNTTLSSVINGLGKTNDTLFINITGLVVRIASVFFLIPSFGIIGYLWGLLASQLIICVVSILFILRLARV